MRAARYYYLTEMSQFNEMLFLCPFHFSECCKLQAAATLVTAVKNDTFSSQVFSSKLITKKGTVVPVFD
jgi:hypothetical protein